MLILLFHISTHPDPGIDTSTFAHFLTTHLLTTCLPHFTLYTLRLSWFSIWSHLRIRRLELVPGSKGSARWLVVDNRWMMVPRGRDPDGVTFHWECRLRRTIQCPAKLTSILDPDTREEKHLVASMVNPHWCEQSEVSVLEHRFRTRIKHLAQTSSGNTRNPSTRRRRSCFRASGRLGWEKVWSSFCRRRKSSEAVLIELEEPARSHWEDKKLSVCQQWTQWKYDCGWQNLIHWRQSWKI